MGLHEALHVKSFTTYGFHCRGLFVKAGSRITKGEDVWWFDKHHDALRIYTKKQIKEAPTKSMTFSEINSTIGMSSNTTSTHDEHVVLNPKAALKTSSYMIDDDCFASTPDPTEDISFFINHSCKPNVGYCGDDKLIALCDIECGEQVLKDYAYTETQDSFHKNKVCRCASQNCRVILNFVQYKDPMYIQEHYSHCSSFIQRKMSENGWVHDDVVRRIVFRPDGKSSLVYGLFALQQIPAETTVVIMSGKIVTGDCLSRLSKRDQQMSFQIDNDKWQIPNPVNAFGSATGAQLSYETCSYINHSCNPNCGMEDATRVVTLRSIGVNEQITIDYAMIRNGALVLDGDVFTCFCGNIGFCRRTITPQDYTIIELNKFKYLSPFVQEMCVRDMTGGITRNLTSDSTLSSESNKTTLSPTSLCCDSLRTASSFSDNPDGEGQDEYSSDLNDDQNDTDINALCTIDTGDDSDTFSDMFKPNLSYHTDADDESDTGSIINLRNHKFAAAIVSHDVDTDDVSATSSVVPKRTQK